MRWRRRSCGLWARRPSTDSRSRKRTRTTGCRRLSACSTTWLPWPPAESLHLGGLELAPAAGPEPSERQAGVRAAVEASNGMAHGLEHPLDLVLAALVQRQLDLRGAA